MRVSIYGLGYVGTVTSACLASLGHDVLGVDVAEAKVDAVRRGESPIVEAGVSELLDEAVRAGRLNATTDQERAARESDVSLVCVGTPSAGDGSTDVQYVLAVAEAVARGRADAEGFHVVAVRSTVPPGTVARVGEILARGLPPDAFGVAANPEFLREGTAVADFRDPPFTVIGTDDERTFETLARVYADLDAPLRRTSVGVAELIKYACNSFHALKVAFANEMGSACRAAGVDGQELMELFCEDRRLNVSKAYLRPGLAYGGSCLPKDVRGLAHQLAASGVEAPLLSSVERANRAHMARLEDLVTACGPQRVALLGLAFKEGTDDVRESPQVGLAETLIAAGVDVTIHDPHVRYASLVGANKAYLDSELPHVTSRLRETVAETVESADVVVLARWEDGLREPLAALEDGVRVVDTVGIPADARAGRFEYVGLCW